MEGGRGRGTGEASVSHGLGIGGPRFMNLLTLKFLIDSSDDFLIYCSKNVQLELLIVQKSQYMLIRISSLICSVYTFKERGGDGDYVHVNRKVKISKIFTNCTKLKWKSARQEFTNIYIYACSRHVFRLCKNLRCHCF